MKLFPSLRNYGKLESYHILGGYVLFCGPSNCGKKNALLALILHPNGLKFDNVYVYSKSLKQPKYKFLEQVLNDVEEVEYYPFSEHEEVIPPMKLNQIPSLYLMMWLVRNRTILDLFSAWVDTLMLIVSTYVRHTLEFLSIWFVIM